MLVLLGDFNARVGVLGPDEEGWRGVIGPHGLARSCCSFVQWNQIKNHEHLVQKDKYALWDLLLLRIDLGWIRGCIVRIFM